MILNNQIEQELKEDYIYCKKIIDKNSKTFSLAFSYLPLQKKQAIWSIYAFNRLLDDLADKKQDILCLNEHKIRFDNLIKGLVYPDPVYRTLADVFNKFEMNPNPFMDMFKGQYYDIDFKAFQTDDELIEYCYLVAGSVGHMILPIIATKNHKQLYESAKNIGIAMQLTNILRDVGEDYSNNRIYLPLEQLENYNVCLEDVYNFGINQNYINLWENYASMAQSYYEKGLNSIHLYDKDSQKVVKTAANLYSKILSYVRKQNYALNK